MAELRAEKVRKEYAGKAVVHDVDVTVEDGEFCAMLGPSGSGKTTLLQLIAGLSPLDGGRILLGGIDVSDRRPERRNIGIVFQSYALFPHLSVAENVAYGLRARKVAHADQKERVDAMLGLVGLRSFHARRPAELSGGQRQRVALARALVIQPDLLLLDEPLSALDRKIRGEMQDELARIHQETGLTTVMVTHDQEEALDLADKVILLKDGRVQQDESPSAMYRNPANPFVADFLGAQHFTGAVVHRYGDGVEAVVDGVRFPLPTACSFGDGTPVDVTVAAEAVEVHTKQALADRPVPYPAQRRGSSQQGTVARVSFFGPTTQAEIHIGSLRVRSLMLSRAVDELHAGAEVQVTFDPRGIQAFAESVAE